MWFAFGFITILVSFLYFLQKKINAGWKGESAYSNGVPYQFQIIKEKNKSTAIIKIGVDVKKGYDFVFKKESLIDRFFKFIGLSIEYQVENKEFDDLIYIASDNAFFHKQIADRIEITDAVMQIYKSADEFQCSMKEVRAQGGRLWVVLKTKNDFGGSNRNRLHSAVVCQLFRISDALVEIPESAHELLKDPFVFKAALILALSTALFANGIIQIFRIEFIDVPFTIDVSKLVMDSILVGSVIISILIAVSVLLLRGSARVHLILIELVLVGYLGAISSSFAELHDINIELDNSEGTTCQVKIFDKKSISGRRFKRHYIYVSNWNGKYGDLEIKVSRGLYNELAVGNQLLLVQKKGFLDYRWVERIEKVE